MCRQYGNAIQIFASGVPYTSASPPEAPATNVIIVADEIGVCYVTQVQPLPQQQGSWSEHPGSHGPQPAYTSPPTQVPYGGSASSSSEQPTAGEQRPERPRVSRQRASASSARGLLDPFPAYGAVLRRMVCDVPWGSMSAAALEDVATWLDQQASLGSRDVRFYAVWDFRWESGQDIRGVNVGVGRRAYDGVVGANGGFGGLLRWRREDTLALAARRYMEEAPAFQAPVPARIILW